MNQQQDAWQKERDDFIRAFSGAFLFGIPLLFTMEMWWIGTYANLWKLIVLLILAFSVNVHLAYFAGFKEERTIRGSILQAVDTAAVGAVSATVVLLILNRVSLDDPLDSILGKVIIQMVPLSIGASVANALFAPRKGGRQGQHSQQQNEKPWSVLLNDLGATIAGSIFIGFSIAPTEEVVRLAAELDYWHELALFSLSFALAYAIVFESGFDPKPRSQHPSGLVQSPLTETTMAYVISLVVALIALFLFDQIEIGDRLDQVVSKTLVLGLPTAIGGAAGRLVI